MIEPARSLTLLFQPKKNHLPVIPASGLAKYYYFVTDLTATRQKTHADNNTHNNGQRAQFGDGGSKPSLHAQSRRGQVPPAPARTNCPKL
jgi:hypothetical protein